MGDCKMRKKIIALVTMTLFIGVIISSATTGYSRIEYDEALNEFLFDKYIEALMKLAHKPSLVTGIIINDTLVWSKGYGLYDIENLKPATEETLYLQASVSKTVAATALMQLYDPSNL